MLLSQIEEQKKKVKLAAPDKNKIKELEAKIENKRKCMLILFYPLSIVL